MDPSQRQSILEQARKSVPEVSAREAKEEMDAGKVGIFLDVREAHELRRGYVPGALRIVLDEVPDAGDPDSKFADETLTAHKDDRIIVYCATGVRSMIAGYYLQKLGYSDVVSMAGGIQGWQQEGNPTDR
ncbi:MAG TPA: rhodanese-like domain-containing protein [Actinomycetota bacterium]|nr:rhodanese-like domain-containing protein [Actinomycetota bacterium]